MRNPVFKRRLIRATTMTIFFVLYLKTFGKFVPIEGTLKIILLISTCILLDFALKRIMKMANLRKYFYGRGN